MRTEKAIKKLLAKFENVEKAGETCIDPIAMYQVAALALRWVLGEDIGKVYYCSICSLFHPEPECPECGGSTIATLQLRNPHTP